MRLQTKDVIPVGERKYISPDAMNLRNMTRNGVLNDLTVEEKLTNFTHYKRVADYLLGKTIGEGSFAKVRLGLHAQTAEEVAVKVICKAKALKDAYVHKNLRREGRILQMTRHQNIIQVYDILETDNNYYLVTEFCGGGELIDIVTDRGGLPEIDVKKYVFQLVSAVAHLHDHGIVHRDLKVENLILDDRGNLKVIDFGLSNIIPSDVSDARSALATQCGSPAYAAPELLAKKHYGAKVDVWSIGVITYALLVGKLPFTAEPFRIPKLCRKMMAGEMNPIPPHLTSNCRNFIKRLLVPEPQLRPGIKQVMKMPWIGKMTKPSNLIKSQAQNVHPATVVNTQIVNEMVTKHGFEAAKVTTCVRKNRPGEALAMYHLLNKQKSRLKSNADRDNGDAIGSDGNLDMENDSDRSDEAKIVCHVRNTRPQPTVTVDKAKPVQEAEKKDEPKPVVNTEQKTEEKTAIIVPETKLKIDELGDVAKTASTPASDTVQNVTDVTAVQKTSTEQPKTLLELSNSRSKNQIVQKETEKSQTSRHNVTDDVKEAIKEHHEPAIRKISKFSSNSVDEKVQIKSLSTKVAPLQKQTVLTNRDVTYTVTPIELYKSRPRFESLKPTEDGTRFSTPDVRKRYVGSTETYPNGPLGSRSSKKVSPRFISLFSRSRKEKDTKISKSPIGRSYTESSTSGYSSGVLPFISSERNEAIVSQDPTRFKYRTLNSKDKFSTLRRSGTVKEIIEKFDGMTDDTAKAGSQRQKNPVNHQRLQIPSMSEYDCKPSKPPYGRKTPRLSLKKSLSSSHKKDDLFDKNDSSFTSHFSARNRDLSLFRSDRSGSPTRYKAPAKGVWYRSFV